MKNAELPNIGITLNNKLVSLQHIFENAGISINVGKNDNFTNSSFIYNAIVNDLFDYVIEASKHLVESNSAMHNIQNSKISQFKALKNVSPIQKLFQRIKSLFVPIKPIDLSVTEEEKNTFILPLEEYKNIDTQIWNYNLEDNVIKSIVKSIREYNYTAYVIPELLEYLVIPDLNSLNLDNLIPQLKQTLIDEYKKDLPDSKIYQIPKQDMYLYVPDFSKNNQVQVENVPQSFSQTEDSSRSIKKDGIKLEDFSDIDKKVSASERRDTISLMSESLKKDIIKEDDYIDHLEDEQL